MGNDVISRRARQIVVDYYNKEADKAGVPRISMDETYTMWMHEDSPYWRVMVVTLPPDGKYYEVSCNNNKQELHVIVYDKVADTVIKEWSTGF